MRFGFIGLIGFKVYKFTPRRQISFMYHISQHHTLVTEAP